MTTSSYLTPKCAVAEYASKGGKGVVALEDIEQGEVIAVWSGRLLTIDQVRQLPEELRAHTAQVEEGLYLTSLADDEPPDYINHSCDPNAGLCGQIVIVAMRPIRSGEEITIDYAMCDGSSFDEFDCLCGAPSCRKRVTGEDWKRQDLWLRYGNHFSPYLLRRIEDLRAQQHD
jgi:SET domain-containing protein